MLSVTKVWLEIVSKVITVSTPISFVYVKVPSPLSIIVVTVSAAPSIVCTVPSLFVNVNVPTPLSTIVKEEVLSHKFTQANPSKK